VAGLNQSTTDSKISYAMFQWIRSGLAGCSFAATLSTVRNRDKWRTIIIPRPPSSAAIKDIDELLKVE